MAYKVFLSYSSADSMKVEAARRILHEAGADVFNAEHDVKSGAALSTNLESAIRDCDVFVLLWSTTAHASDWVRHEIGVARGADKQVIPVLLDREATLPPFLADLKYLAAYESFSYALDWLRQDIHDRVQRRNGRDGLIKFGVVAAIFAALARDEAAA